MKKVLSDNLVAKFRNGNVSAFNELYDALYKLVYYNALKIVDNLAAEEITASAFVTLWQKKESFSSLKDVKGFLMVVSRNAALNKVRTVRPSLQLVGVDDLSFEGLQHEADYITEIEFEAIQRIVLAMNQLPEQQRNVVNLAFFEGLSNTEIATRLNLSLRTIKNHKYRALSTLRNTLKSPEDYALLYMLVTATYLHG